LSILLIQRLEVDLDGFSHIRFEFAQGRSLGVTSGQLSHRANQPVALGIALDNDGKLVGMFCLPSPSSLAL
jgi:hypothetical protein